MTSQKLENRPRMNRAADGFLRLGSGLECVNRESATSPAFFVDRVFIRAVAWPRVGPPRARRSENAVYVA